MFQGLCLWISTDGHRTQYWAFSPLLETGCVWLVKYLAACHVQVLTGTCVDYWAPKTVRASMGASFRLPSLRLESWGEVVGEFFFRPGVRHEAACDEIR